MKNIVIFISLLSCLSSVYAQKKQNAVQQTIETFFDGMHKADTLLISTTLHTECLLSSVLNNSKAETFIRKESISNFKRSIANKPSNVTFEERILNYDIKIDENMAIAWTPYHFYLNEKFLHCGVNVFVLAYLEDQWKILSITDTRRKEECPKE